MLSCFFINFFSKNKKFIKRKILNFSNLSKIQLKIEFFKIILLFHFFGKIFGYGNIEIQSFHGGYLDITLYHMENGKMITHYIDKLIYLNLEERKNFSEFDPEYFKKVKRCLRYNSRHLFSYLLFNLQKFC